MKKTFNFEEIQDRLYDSEYDLYRHKKTKKCLTDILEEYISDYQIKVEDDNWGNKSLIVRVYDRNLQDTPDDVYFTMELLSY